MRTHELPQQPETKEEIEQIFYSFFDSESAFEEWKAQKNEFFDGKPPKDYINESEFSELKQKLNQIISPDAAAG